MGLSINAHVAGRTGASPYTTARKPQTPDQDAQGEGEAEHPGSNPDQTRIYTQPEMETNEIN